MKCGNMEGIFFMDIWLLIHEYITKELMREKIASEEFMERKWKDYLFYRSHFKRETIRGNMTT